MIAKKSSFQISRSFCKSFLKLLNEVHEDNESGDYNTTDLIVKLFERVSALIEVCYTRKHRLLRIVRD